ncbi:protein SGT1 homolog isoform X1 [Eriocheir sinensis]|uniref:protein SGT1 homolog isoform X1 n=2 Tax=Eriocheir sinensis TaxID=95602 RepID=UPI0021CA518B|nr:protein SGT1 homolog isoform X1 [Eriocheir sinensis]
MPLTSLQGQMSMLTTEDQYIQAVEQITSEIKEKPDRSDKGELFLLRAQNLLKLEKFKEAYSDASRAIELDARAEAHLVQGKALFSLGRFVESLDAFKKGKARGGIGKLDQFGQWITWCEERIKKLGISDSKDTSSETNMEEKNENSAPAAGDSTSTPTTADSHDAMPVPKIKHDWYQTEAFVIVTVLVKNLKKEDVKVDFTEKTASVSAPLPSGSEYSLELDLCHPINPEQSGFRVVPSKVEIKMKKVDGIRWATLEGDGEPPFVKANLPETESDKVVAYPSSAPKKHDWDKLEAQVKKEEEEEKLEGDAALNQLFQKIYGQGSEETRRAMNKSFMESGGTVLSTNWKEVAGQKVDVKPPDGMEWKKWNQ